jgi:hypothetical protein
MLFVWKCSRIGSFPFSFLLMFDHSIPYHLIQWLLSFLAPQRMIYCVGLLCPYFCGYLTHLLKGCSVCWDIFSWPSMVSHSLGRKWLVGWSLSLHLMGKYSVPLAHPLYLQPLQVVPHGLYLFHYPLSQRLYFELMFFIFTSTLILLSLFLFGDCDLCSLGCCGLLNCIYCHNFSF